jgi:hypothetical protein
MGETTGTLAPAGVVSALLELDVRYKIFLSVLFAFVLHRLSTTRRPYKLFPSWAALEVGLTSHLLLEGGVGFRIL